MSEPHRLHILAVVTVFIKTVRSWIIPLAVFIFGTVFRDLKHMPVWVIVLGAFVLFLLFAVPSVIYWYRFTYRVEDGELKIEHGLFVKKHRYIRKERIQSIDRTESLINRPFGLVKVKIETAGGNAKEPEVDLTAITRERARQLEVALYGTEDETESGEATEEEKVSIPLRELPFSDLFIAGATSGKIGVVFSIIAVIFGKLNDILPEDFYEGVYQRLVAASFQLITLLVFVIAVGAWIVAILGTILRYNGFTLTRKDRELHIVSGLLERRQLTIPLHRVQAIRIVEGVLRQPFGFVTVYVESAGGSGEKGEDFSTVLFPLLRKKEVAPFLDEFVPGYPAEFEWVPVPKRALRRYLIWPFIIALVISVPVTIWVPWGEFSLLLLPIAAILGMLRYHDAAWSTTSQYRVLRFRDLGRTTVIVPRKNIQDREMHQSFFQKRGRLATYQLSIMSKSHGKEFRVKHINENEVRELIETR